MKVYYLLSTPGTDVGLAELNMGFQSLCHQGECAPQAIRIHELMETDFQPGDVIIFHLPNDGLTREACDKDFHSRLLKIAEGGTSLLFTLAAANLPYEMGIEKLKPTVNETGRWRKETGFFAYRGFCAYAEHPLFNYPNKFRNRFFSWSPQNGEPYWRTIYRACQPEKTIARGIRFLSAMDDEACIWEYEVGKGRILCVGANLYHNARRNYQRHFAEAFMVNCVHYLKGDNAPHPPDIYWPKPSIGIEEITNSEELKIPAVKFRHHDEKYFKREGVPSLQANQGNNFFSCAGRRILLLSSEGSYINEIWSYPCRLMRNYIWSIKPDGKGDIPARGMPCDSTVYPDAVHQQYEYTLYGVREQIGANIFQPAAYHQMEVVAERDYCLSLKFTVDFAVMWPMPRGVAGKIRYHYDKESKLLKFRSQNRQMWCALSLSDEPETVNFKDVSDKHESLLEVEILFPLKQPGLEYYSFIIVGGTDSHRVKEYTDKIDLSSSLDIDASGDHYRKMQESLFTVETPDDDINQGVLWAQLKSEAFRAVTPGVGRGLTAGLSFSGDGWLNARPGYGWYFGRDSMWTSLGLQSAGLWNAASDSLKMLADRQDFDGKIFHELSPSGFAHYDAADANLLFLITAERYLAWTGDDKTINQIMPALKKALEFSFRSDRDGDCLTENTGVGHGWIESGKLHGAHVTFYLAGLWLSALQASKILFRNDKDKTLKNKIDLYASKVRELIHTLFWDEEKQKYFYALRKDEGMQRADTIMPSAVILFGNTEVDHDLLFLKSASGPDIVTDWGARMISEQHEDYNPLGYHIGSVWPLYTGWLGLAQYRRHNSTQGFELLSGGFSTYNDFSVGCYSEVLRGDYYDEAGICPQQAWSASMMLWLLTKGMLGLDPDVDGTMRMRPAIPLHWHKATFKNIRWADGIIHLRYRRKRKVMEFKIEKFKLGERINFAPVLPRGCRVRKIKVNKDTIKPNINNVNNRPALDIPISGAGGDTTIKIFLERLLAPRPCLVKPKFRQPSQGFRIIDYDLTTDSFWVELKGRSGSQWNFVITDPDELLSLENTKALRFEEEVTLPVVFPKSQEQYSSLTIRFVLKQRWSDKLTR